jgi:hypothetical protein
MPRQDLSSESGTILITLTEGSQTHVGEFSTWPEQEPLERVPSILDDACERPHRWTHERDIELVNMGDPHKGCGCLNLQQVFRSYCELK